MSIKEQLWWLPTTYPINSSSGFLILEHRAGLPQNKVQRGRCTSGKTYFSWFKSYPEHASGAANTFLILLTKA